MQLLRLLVVFTLFTSFLNAQYLRSIRIGSFASKQEAESALVQVNKFAKLHDNIRTLQEIHKFNLKMRKSGKMYITLVEPLRDKKVLQELLDTLRLKYPDAYVKKLLKDPQPVKLSHLKVHPIIQKEAVVKTKKILPKKNTFVIDKYKREPHKNSTANSMLNTVLLILIALNIIFINYYGRKNSISLWKSIDTRVLTILLGLFILFYPMLAIFTLAFLMIYDKRFDNLIVLFYVILFFTLIFYLRIYGPSTSIDGSQDDSITYLRIFSLFQNNGYIDFFRAAKRENIEGLEALYWLVYYSVGVVSDFSRDVYVFANFFIPISLFIITLRLIFKENYLLAFLLVSTFAYQYYYALVFSIWRQSLAFSVLILSLYYIGKEYKKSALALLVSAVFIHTSSAIFLFVYSVYLLVTSKIKVSHALFYLLVSIIFGIIILQLYGDALENKHDVYTSAKYVGSARLSFIIKFVGALAIAIYMLKKSFDREDKFLMGVSFFVAFGYVVVLMSMNMLLINTRLQLTLNLMFLIMIFYYITKYFNYKKNIYIFIHFLVFLIFFRFTQDENFYSKFLLDEHFNEILLFSLKDLWMLSNVARGY